MRVLVADDTALFREGLVRLLEEAGHDVTAVADAEALVAACLTNAPDVAVVDVRMPPTMTDDGARAVQQLRSADPHLPVVLLSQHVETRRVRDLLATRSFGYLLKDRVLHVEEFLDAMCRVAAGGSALDPAIVGSLLTSDRPDDPLRALSPREVEVLALAAEGRSNASIASHLVVAERTVEAHMRSVFAKLRIPDSGDNHRRVLAVVAYLTR
jgi:DNA-binding NarL/FixJ family response regulator